MQIAKRTGGSVEALGMVCRTGDNLPDCKLGAPVISLAAQSYDDPAVAICEAVALHDQMENSSYKRISGDVYGLTASIIYEISALNLAPTTQIAECHYRQSDGSYILDFAITKDERACQDAGADWNVLGKHPDRLTEEAVIAATLCESYIAAVTNRETAIEPWLKLARDAGAYPIATTATALNTGK